MPCLWKEDALSCRWSSSGFPWGEAAFGSSSWQRANRLYEQLTQDEYQPFDDPYVLHKYKHNAAEFVERELEISAYECGEDGGEFPVYECPECGEEQLVYDIKAWKGGKKWNKPRVILLTPGLWREHDTQIHKISKYLFWRNVPDRDKRGHITTNTAP